MGVEDDAEDDADDAATSRPALGPSDWHSARCAKAQNLVEPADDDEKSTWDNDLLPLRMQPGKDCHDLEDVDRHYKIINCSKTSSDYEVKERYNEKWNTNRAKVIKYHPDKPTADSEKYNKAKSVRDKLKAAKKVLCTQDANGCYTNRVEYDQKGEMLRQKMKEEIRTVYNCSVEQRAKEIKIRIARDKVFKEKFGYAGVTKATLLTKLSKAWVTAQNSQQTNKVRTILCQLFQLNYTNQDIALEVRRYSFKNIRFDESLLTKDNQYQTIMRRIRNTRKSYEGGELNELLNMKGREKQSAMKKKSPKLGSRGRKATEQQNDLEKQLYATIEKWIKDERRITRTMIFREALKIDPLFKGGVASGDLMTKLKKWFYYGFVKRFNLSIRKIASVGQKLPQDWKDKMVDMRGRVKHRQLPTEQPDGSIVLKGVHDANYFNTDHVPVWYESVGNYSWGKKDSGRRTVKTGGKEKDRFTAQLGVGKGGKKLTPFLIFKAKPVKPGKKCGNKNSVTYEIKERLPDAEGNPYPSRDKCYIVVSESANSNKDLTEVYVKKIVLPAAGYNKETGQCDNQAGLLWDDFKAHSCKDVKDFCQSRDFLGVDIIPGGLTPEAQPLDKVINKVFKGYFRDLYDEYILNAPITEKGNPKPPSRQLLATWVVKAWDMIPEDLVRKSWTACGYQTEEQLCSKTQGQMVVWDENAIIKNLAEICGEDAVTHYRSEENDDETGFFDFLGEENDAEAEAEED